MNRREILQSALATGMLYSLGGVPRLGSVAHAMGFPPVGNRVLVNIMLAGGPDMRHILPPPYDPDPSSFGYTYWQAKADAHRVADQPSAWETRWQDDFFHVSDGQTTFGIHRLWFLCQ